MNLEQLKQYQDKAIEVINGFRQPTIQLARDSLKLVEEVQKLRLTAIKLAEVEIKLVQSEKKIFEQQSAYEILKKGSTSYPDILSNMFGKTFK